MKTIKDLAAAANCSISTVSKALNDRPDVSKQTKEKIIEIAALYNFYPSAYGKGLKRKLTENVGVIFCRESQPLSSNPFYSRVLEGIEGELAISNYNLVLHLIPDEGRVELPKMMREKQVDGVIIVGVIKQTFMDKLESNSLPAILIDSKLHQSEYSQILIDNEHGAFDATQFLIQNGHKRIGFISGDLDRLSFQQRLTGYLKALKYHSIDKDDNLIVTGGLEQGYEHTKMLLDLVHPPTAIFSANDINAIYGYKAILEKGLRIPEDISIIGFDDISLSKMSSPPLTTIRVYKEEMGSIAVRHLLRSIKGEENAPTTMLVPTRVVDRESVANLKL